MFTYLNLKFVCASNLEDNKLSIYMYYIILNLSANESLYQETFLTKTRINRNVEYYMMNKLRNKYFRTSIHQLGSLQENHKIYGNRFCSTAEAKGEVLDPVKHVTPPPSPQVIYY